MTQTALYNLTSSEFNLKQMGLSMCCLCQITHHQNNGLGEHAVQSFKQSLLKIQGGSMEEKISNILFFSHITLHSMTGLSLAESIAR